MIEWARKSTLLALATLHWGAWAAAPAPATPAAAPAILPSASGVTAATQPTPASQRQAPIEASAQRIHVEDGGAAIDELRVGGQTRHIDVQPKGGMPAYQVAPQSGERSWKVLGF